VIYKEAPRWISRRFFFGGADGAPVADIAASFAGAQHGNVRRPVS